MNKLLVLIAAAVFASLTWAQSKTSSTSQNGSIGDVQTFRGAIIDARCVPSDRSDSVSAAIVSPTNSKASKRKSNNSPSPQTALNGQRDMGVNNDMCQPSQTTRMFALRTVDGRILSFDDTSNTKVVGQFMALVDSSSAQVQSSPSGEITPGTQTANSGRATGGPVEVVGRLQGTVLQAESSRPIR